MKTLLLTIVLIGISVNGAAQTTTGTAQKVGNIWYYNFYTQPAPLSFPIPNLASAPSAFYLQQMQQPPLGVQNLMISNELARQKLELENLKHQQKEASVTQSNSPSPVVTTTTAPALRPQLMTWDKLMAFVWGTLGPDLRNDKITVAECKRQFDVKWLEFLKDQGVHSKEEAQPWRLRMQPWADYVNNIEAEQSKSSSRAKPGAVAAAQRQFNANCVLRIVQTEAFKKASEKEQEELLNVACSEN